MLPFTVLNSIFGVLEDDEGDAMSAGSTQLCANAIFFWMVAGDYA